MLKIVVCVSGGGTNLQAIIDGIASNTITNTQIVRVVSNNKKAFGLERARKNGIDAMALVPSEFKERSKFNEAFLQAVDEVDADLLVLAGFLVVIPEAIIEKYNNRIINVHPSLIPSFCGTGYYGLKVHEGALSRGVKVTGATVHFVDKGTDTGPIIMQKSVEVKITDTPEILQKRVMEQAEWVIMPKAIDLIANGKIKVVNGRVIVEESLDLKNKQTKME
ncbi:MAG TPA: phosphoribosylglycinamide formyltransferase [Lachnospiraceae bacterium]|nr:phosphoribosylglycinamide formyltransferase [Lachnospiraceae bacterium]